MSVSIRPAAQPDVAYIAESLIAIARTVRERTGSAYNNRLPETVTTREFEYVLGYVQDKEKDKRKLALIAEENGAHIGCLLAEITPSSVPTLNAENVGTIAACWVSPEFRKQGTAKVLVGQAEAWLRAQGVRFAELSYGADSETAGAAWTAQGYAPFRVFAVKDLGASEHPAPQAPSL